ncbi:hypothetical protein EON65_32310 [archaeon]|nr:MAG: hypothetical protein EON65_32310 [archaeon]
MEQRVFDIVTRSSEESTVLLVDTTGTEESLRVFQNSSNFVVFDAKAMHTKRLSRNQGVPALLEEARNLLTFALMRGKTLVVRLGDAAVDFNSTFCDDSCEDIVSQNPRPPYQQWEYVPRGFMLQSGSPLKVPPYPDTLYRRDDINDISSGMGMHLHPNFKVIVSTTLPENRLDDMLFNGKYGLPGMKRDYQVVKLE